MDEAPSVDVPESEATDESPLLEAKSIYKTFPNGVRAAIDISLGVARGEILGLVGESGSGKSTLGRLVLRLLRPDKGSVEYCGQDLSGIPRRHVRRLRGKLQLVPQSPATTLNPRLSINDSIEFNLRAQRWARSARKARVANVLDLVGMRPGAGRKRPYELSGGELQRIAIARALATEPELILCDEPVSSLDQSIQARILNLLAELHAELGVGYIIISHDMEVIEHIADRVAVMYLGRIVELGPARALLNNPLHPYTHHLLSARPGQGGRPLAAGEGPSSAHLPSGCAFRTLCPKANSVCAKDPPPALLEKEGAHWAACHHTDRTETS